VKTAARAGVRVVQYRRKCGATRALVEEALILRQSCPRSLFIVNDRIDVALASGADGVHVGRDDMPCRTARRLMGPNAIIGVTVHGVEEALEAERAGADYVAASPIFSSRTKPDAGEPVGTGLVRVLRARLRIPVVAIGGIDTANARSVIEAGADAICAISAVLLAADPGAEMRGFMDLYGGR
jgi:thiamine-phosphate pyrophosphorylase